MGTGRLLGCWSQGVSERMREAAVVSPRGAGRPRLYPSPHYLSRVLTLPQLLSLGRHSEALTACRGLAPAR